MVRQIDEKIDFTPESNKRLDRNLHGSMRARQHGSFRVDDVIASLSNAYENRRARQVMEWEKLGRQNLPSPV